MKKPLWIFFTALKDQTPLVLSIDQYFYFFEAFQQLPLYHFSHYHELRDFCKIFWLNDYRFEKEFDQTFDAMTQWAEIGYILSPEKKTPPPPPEPPVPGPEPPGPKPPRPEPPGPEPPGPEPPRPVSSEPTNKADFVDFELILREEQGTKETSIISMNQLEHDFALEDQSIMPFRLRYFAQRLRRSVETTEKVMADELDYEQMIKQYCEDRYLNKIVYKFRDSSKSNVVLLADRFGSMLAYEYLELQLRDSISAIPNCHFEQYYFYNIPRRSPDKKHYLLNTVTGRDPVFKTKKQQWDKNTWFFILSDAGAHSGEINEERIDASLAMWKYFKAISKHVYWINPVPKIYMENKVDGEYNDTTAQRLNLIVDMIYPTEKNLNQFFNQV